MSMQGVKTGLLRGAIVLLCVGGGANAQAQATLVATAQQAIENAAPFRKIIGVKTAMRDGVQLVSDVWLPAAEGKYPVILMRSPYRDRPGRLGQLGEYFARHGYAFVIQDGRGTGDSEGEFDFFFPEAKDGYDTIEALAAQPWANGRLCMMGVSYLGTVQWLAAKEKPPHLTCIAPTAAGGQFLDEIPSSGGAFMFQWALQWLRMVTSESSQSGSVSPDWKTVLAQRPLLTLDEVTGGRMRVYRDFLEHDTLDDYWKRIDLTAEDFAKVDIPVLKTTGWFDVDQTGALFFWNGLEGRAIRAPDQYLTIGPWNHVETFYGGHESQGAMKLPGSSIIDNKATHLAFFDHYLKKAGPKPDWPRVRLFVTGADIWRNFDSYPVAGATPRRLYLSGGGYANSLKGDGALSWDRPGNEPVDEFLFDPKNPVVLDFTGPLFGMDRIKEQSRQDILVYTTKPLTEALEVIGPVALELYAASDARDTDFTAVISDVGADGKAILLGSKPVGIIRARYRGGREAEPSLLTPGKVELYTIDLGAIGHRFLPGHSIRVEVSSSAYPMFNPNQNTGNPIATDTEWKVARQSIFHDSARPSALILPVFKE